MTSPLLEKLGKPGVTALGVLIFCVAIYLGDIAPDEEKAASLEQQAATLAGQRATSATSARPGAPAATAPATPPVDANAFLKTFNALASQNGLNIERATYQPVEREGRRRLQINVPVRTTYPTLRRWLDALLADPASPAIDALTLQRSQAGDPLIDASVQVSVEIAP